MWWKHKKVGRAQDLAGMVPEFADSVRKTELLLSTRRTYDEWMEFLEKLEKLEKPMSKHKFIFDFTRFGHNEKVAKDLTQEILDTVSAEIESDLAPPKMWEVTNPVGSVDSSKPRGGYVRPGQRVRYAGLKVTMAPVRHNQSDPYFYWDDGRLGSAPGWEGVTTLGGEPVLGYEGDK